MHQPQIRTQEQHSFVEVIEVRMRVQSIDGSNKFARISERQSSFVIDGALLAVGLTLFELIPDTKKERGATSRDAGASPGVPGC